MKRGLWNYIYMSLGMALFMVGSLDAFGVWRIAALQNVLNLPSLFVIVGGSFFQVFAAFPAQPVIRAVQMMVPTFTTQSARSRDEEIIENVLETVRGLRMDKRGTIDALMNAKSKGFKIYLGELLSTNYGPEEIRILGLHKINTMKQAEMIPYKVVNVLASSSPAYGMLGTLMGLIVMLGNFEDASGLASGLAIALMTTFYGLLMTQFVWQPLANKIQATANDNQLKREVELEGVLLTLENRPELYIIDQLSAMMHAYDGLSSAK
jgi:chemotaxis protein MotA